ncbi:MAG: N-acetylmuramoyl-L-alanine amidase family protein [Oscillospiraceae bacterium]
MNIIKRSIICTSTAAAIVLSSGALAFSASAEWHKNKDGYYYTLEDGDRVTGWQKIGTGKYYFGNNGIAVTGFKKIKGNTFYFDPEKHGRMTTSWKTIDGSRYYFGTDGVMRTGWKNINGNTYYFSSSGKAATGAVRIDGTSYTFSSRGILQKSSDSASSSTGSTSVFADNAFGKAAYGMSSEEVITANKLKEYITLGETDDYHVIAAKVSSYLGSKSKNIQVWFFFDKSDKLIAVIAIDLDNSSASSWEKYAIGKFGAPIDEEESSALYGDKKTNKIVFLFNSDGNNLIMEMDADDYDTVYEAFLSLSGELEQ